MPSNPNLPNYTRPEVSTSLCDLELMADLLAGTRRMHEQATKYIRKWADEKPDVYAIRKQCETVFEGTGRTLSAATGMLFAKAPQIEWNASETIASPQWDNIDNAGTKGTVFVKRYAEACLRDGYSVIVVDHPTAPDGVTVTADTEATLNLRPVWKRYDRASIINWQTAVINNQTAPILVVFQEGASVADKSYGILIVTRFRVLRLMTVTDKDTKQASTVATWTLFEQVAGSSGEKADDFTLHSSGVFRGKSGALANFLPVAIGYAGRTDAPFTATLPLLGVAWANLAHWQQATNLRFYRELCAFPQRKIMGELQQEILANGTTLPGKVRSGPGVVLRLAENASAEWDELQGTSMDQLVQGITDKEQQMSKLGMSFLAKDTRAAETAEAKRLDATAENSTLATAGQGIEDAVNAAWEMHGWYLGIEKKDCPLLTIARDFDSTAMDPATMAVYIQAVRDAGLPVRLLLEAWQAGGRIPPDTDLDELEMEMMAAKAASDAAAADALAAQQDQNGQQPPDVKPPVQEAA